MKRIFSILVLLLVGFSFGQEKNQYLEIDYSMKFDMDIEEILENVPADWRALVEQQIKQELSDGVYVDYKLKTNGTESEYKMVEKLNNAQGGGGMIAGQIVAMDKEPLYKNIAEKYYLKPYNFGRAYLVKDDLNEFDWKISREKTEISGFETYKATGMLNDSTQVTAWYTPKINIKDGPDKIWGLPGLILKAEFKTFNADVVITAVKVAVRDEEIKIDKPNKGKVVTEEEYMEEMKALQEIYKDMYSEGVDTN